MLSPKYHKEITHNGLTTEFIDKLYIWWKGWLKFAYTAQNKHLDTKNIGLFTLIVFRISKKSTQLKCKMGRFFTSRKKMCACGQSMVMKLLLLFL